MSFPKIPDIEPYISITFEDAINLLLTSIALEEVSLSKLIEAETHKILCVIEDCNHKHSALQDALAVNKSVDDTVKNIIKLQMLLQFKLENIKEMLPSTTTSTTTSTSTSTTTTCTKTTSHTTTCTASSSTTTSCNCYLIGKGCGIVTNECDKFYGHTAILQANILNGEKGSQALRYFVQNEENSLSFAANDEEIKFKCPSLNHPNKIIVYGIGRAVKKSKKQTEISGLAKFILRVYKSNKDDIGFKMEIFSEEISEINHDSGMVQLIKSENR